MPLGMAASLLGMAGLALAIWLRTTRNDKTIFFSTDFRLYE
ncbi:hypothetical protein B4113_2817 [Geobacillus sp. B4113_201601]|nr:hypothetical protein B4113_2817 [Geobacillus sp. B4113_201601]